MPDTPFWRVASQSAACPGRSLAAVWLHPDRVSACESVVRSPSALAAAVGGGKTCMRSGAGLARSPGGPAYGQRPTSYLYPARKTIPALPTDLQNCSAAEVNVVNELARLRAQKSEAWEERERLLRELAFSEPELTVSEKYARELYLSGIDLPKELLPRATKKRRGEARPRGAGQRLEEGGGTAAAQYSDIEASTGSFSRRSSARGSSSVSAANSRSESKEESEVIDDYQVDYQDEEADISDKIGGDD